MAAINGTTGTDTLQGTAEDGRIDAGAGNDRVSGEGGDDRIDAAVQAGVVPPLMAVLRDPSEPKTRTPALRTLCNILTGSSTATQVTTM